MSFIKRWSEGLDVSGGFDVPGVVSGPSDGDGEAGVVLGNLGAKVVGTLSDWVSDGGFLVRVRNSEVLNEGIERLHGVIQDFNRRASRLIARSEVGSTGLQELQKRWFFTVGARLSAMRKGGEEQSKALEQLKLVAPKLEAFWTKYMTGDEAQRFGIRVTNPEMVLEPSGAPDEESVPGLPEPELGSGGQRMELPVDAPGVMDGAPAGPGLGTIPSVGQM